MEQHRRISFHVFCLVLSLLVISCRPVAPGGFSYPRILVPVSSSLVLSFSCDIIISLCLAALSLFFFLKYLLFKQALLFDEQNAIESGSNSEYIRNVKDWRRRLERIETYRMYFFCFVASCCLALCQFVAYRRVPYLLFRSIYHIFRVITALFYRWYALIAGLRRSTPCWELRSGPRARFCDPVCIVALLLALVGVLRAVGMPY